MKIQSVAVLGAGAVGSYVIWGLSHKKDIRLGVIAEGERADRLKKGGCWINDEVYCPEVWSPQEAEDVDLLIVSLKYGSLPEALESIKTIVGEHAAPFDSERVQAIESLFADTGIHFRSTEFIREEIWGKFRLNVCNNLPQAILGAGVGCYIDSTHMKVISDGLRRELEQIALAKGINMSKIAGTSGRGSAVPASARYSTLQDLDAGRHTEIDMFSGTLMRMGEELGIPTPYNEYTYHMIKALEEKNDGLFDYQGERDKITWAK